MAAALAVLVGWPAGLAPGGAPARASELAAEVESPQLAAPGGGRPADEIETPLDGQTPSIHYRHDLEHEGDAITFEPGERVTHPFMPHPGDDWQVDGEAPRPLPAGHATGVQMRNAAPGATWAAGMPSDVVSPAHFGESSAGVAAEPGGAALASTTLDPTREAMAAAPIGPSGLRREIFGFLPYWELSDRSTVLDWRTLSTIAYFSVGCTSSGGLLKTNGDGSTSTGWAGWTSSKMTSVINAAHQNRTRVTLTITCFAWSNGGAAIQAALLGSSTARSRLARQVAAAVRDRGADGVNLDFEPIVAGYSEEFTKLVRSVRSELNAIAPGYQLTFDAMGSIGNQPIAEATAPGGADAVLVMGYDYRTASSSVAGSISPLTGPVYDLTDTVRAYTAKIPPSKVILGIPYYGRAWSTPTDALHAKNISGAKYGGSAEPSYAQAVDLVAAYGRRWDSVEQAPWTSYRRETCTAAYGCVTSWRQLYYDDAASLRLRYDLVNRTSLRGAGIWALGYDNGRPELRAALADKFLADRTPPLTGVTTFPQQQRDEGFRVAWVSYDDSSVRSYDVQVSTDGGAFGAWLAGTTLTSSIFLGTHGRTYAFRVRATDVHGNVSAWKSIPLGALAAPGSITVGGFGTVVTDGRIDHDHAGCRRCPPGDRRTGRRRGLRLVPGRRARPPVGAGRRDAGRRLGRRIGQRRHQRRASTPRLRHARQRRPHRLEARGRRRARANPERRREAGQADHRLDEPPGVRQPVPPRPSHRRDAGRHGRVRRGQAGHRRPGLPMGRPARRGPGAGGGVRDPAPGHRWLEDVQPPVREPRERDADRPLRRDGGRRRPHLRGVVQERAHVTHQVDVGDVQPPLRRTREVADGPGLRPDRHRNRLQARHADGRR
jgi:spore germination protein YaaH